MSRTLTELVAELGEATRSFNRASTSSGGDAASALGQVYEVALRELHLLQHERQKWELERKQAAARDQCIVDEQARNAHIIKLNVGGVLFVTTRATLCRPGSYFEAMFSGRHALVQVDGAYYLDRNGRVFEGVLDFMRTGIVQPPPNVTFEQLMHELDYFLLLERSGKSDRDDEANAHANGSNSFVLRRTPEVSELEVGSAVWVKEQQETLYNYPRGARSHFGSKATVSDLFFAGNSMQQIGLTFKDGFTYYFCCRDIEMEDHTLELEHMAL
jgi:hypothetical protein